jgi:hypothetical protein
MVLRYPPHSEQLASAPSSLPSSSPTQFQSRADPPWGAGRRTYLFAALLVTVVRPDGVVTNMSEGRVAVIAFPVVGVAGYALVVTSALLYGLLGALLVLL